MKEFFISPPEQTQILLHAVGEGKDSVPVEAVDIIDIFVEARRSSGEAGNPKEWHLYFQKDFYSLTGMKISKTEAVLLYKEACDLVDSIKKNGLSDTEQSEQSVDNTSSPSEM